MLLYYITDRSQFPGTAGKQRERLLAKIAEAARCGVDFIQLRERDLPVRELEQLAREAAQIVRRADEQRETRNAKPETRLLINSRTDVALAAGADGVHLRSTDISPNEARVVWAKARSEEQGTGNAKRETAPGVFAVSCHTVAEVRMAEAQGADFAVFAPVFEKVMAPQRAGIGLDALREACQGAPAAGNVEGVGSSRMPVLALGGVTLENASACIEAGAAGIAGIRLFQDNNITDVIRQIRTLQAPSGRILLK
jgi:thiamine-phosphate pyrophosphorylase